MAVAGCRGNGPAAAAGRAAPGPAAARRRPWGPRDPLAEAQRLTRIDSIPSDVCLTRTVISTTSVCSGSTLTTRACPGGGRGPRCGRGGKNAWHRTRTVTASVNLNLTHASESPCQVSAAAISLRSEVTTRSHESSHGNGYDSLRDVVNKMVTVYGTGTYPSCYRRLLWLFPSLISSLQLSR
jgi:hypothetical protein